MGDVDRLPYCSPRRSLRHRENYLPFNTWGLKPDAGRIHVFMSSLIILFSFYHLRDRPHIRALGHRLMVDPLLALLSHCVMDWVNRGQWVRFEAYLNVIP